MKTSKLHHHCLLLGLAIVAGPSHAPAQSMAFTCRPVFTYQGRVTDNGTNFTGTGQFKLALLTPTNTSSQASAAVAAMEGAPQDLSVTAIAVVNGGGGYVTPPAVTVLPPSGGGATATAVATVSGGVVTAISVTSGGSGYWTPPVVTIAPPPAHYVNQTIWSNDGTSSGEPAATLSVGVSDGLFTVVLGDTNLSNMTAIPASVLTRPNLALQIWFNDGVQGFAALTPAQSLTPVPQAVVAGTAAVAQSATIAQSASNLLGVLPASQLAGTVPLANIPAAVLTNGEASATFGNVGIGTANPTETLEINGTTRLDNNDMFFRGPGDYHHGLGYRDTIAGTTVDGPYLFGWSGGALGTKGGEPIALQWDARGSAYVNNNLAVNAGLSLDQTGQNIGNIQSNAVVFGAAYGQTGEGIASNRGGETDDLEFFTDWKNRMTIAHDGNVGIGTTTPSLPLEINGDSRIDDYAIYFRAGTDMNHALGYRQTIAGTTVDGPFLYGYSGGALGTPSPDLVALQWDRTGSVTVNSNLTVNGQVGIGGGPAMGLLTLNAASNTAPALAISHGAIRVAGAGLNTFTAAFIHVVPPKEAGTCYTEIDNPMCNGNPNAILFITYNGVCYNSSWNQVLNHPTSVEYDQFDGKWQIWLCDDSNDLSAGDEFNVLVIVP
jgi:hypothetical protein